MQQNGAVIAFLDANVLMQDPMCAGTTWQVFAHAPDSWQLRLVTSEIAVAEAVAGYKREINMAIEKLSSISGNWDRIGALADANSTKAALLERAERSQSNLEGSLGAAGVEILKAPDVPHMDVVARSTARRRPCDQAGDGYRDTLIWLTALKVAEDSPGEQLIFVTNDSDFMDETMISIQTSVRT